MSITVREVSSTGEKSAAEIEDKLINQQQQQDQPPADPNNLSGEPPKGVDEPEIKEEQVLAYIGKRYNKEIKSFDEITALRNEAEDLPEDVSAFLKFKKETGRGISDFIKLQEDVDSIDPDQLLKRYFLETEEGIDETDVDLILSDFQYDEDLDDESDVKKAKLAKKKAVAKARAYFSEQKEKYKQPLESSKVAIPDDEKESYEAFKQYIEQAKTVQEQQDRKRQWFQQKTDEVFNGDFKGFEFNVNDRKIVFSPGDSAEIKKSQSTPANFINKFLDDDGLMKDAAGYHKALAMAMNPDKFAKFFYEQGASDALDKNLRTIKNVQMSEQRTPQAISKGGVQVREVNPDGGRGLKIKSAKRL